MTEPPEPTREQLAKIDELAGIYDSVEVRTSTVLTKVDLERVPVCAVTCWRYRESGAKLVAHALTIHPDGAESDRR